MVWYVALVAILNLGLGYALAVFLGNGRQRDASSPVNADESLSTAALADSAAEESPAEESAVFSADEQEESPYNTDAKPTSEPPAAAGASLAAHVDPVTGLTTRECIQKQLTDMTLVHTDRQPMTVALVEVDGAAQGAEGVEDRLLRGVADTVREIMADMQTAGRYSDQQFLLLLPHDDLQHATQRAEQVRQRVEATQYIADGQPIQATITCALTQVAASQTADNLLEFLTETLEEAKRYGGNRTFMHDGTSPTPVVPPVLDIAPQACAI